MKISIRNFFITLLAALLVFGVAAYFIASFVTETLTESIEGKPPVSLEIITADNQEESDTDIGEEIPELKGESFTFAIIGTDYQPDTLLDYNIEDEFKDGFPKRRNRTYSADSITIVRADKESRKLLISAIPSNMRFEVDGHITTLGELYYTNGLEFFLGKLTALTGFEIDKYFVIDIENFAPIIDAVGGVSFNVPEDMQYEDEEQKLKIDLKKGKQNLDGEKAEQLLRFNNYKSYTNSRMNTTVQFMLAAAEKISDASFIQKATTILPKIIKNTTTNYTLEDLTPHLELFADYDMLEKETSIYPGKYIIIDGVQKFDPDIKQAISFYANYR